MKIFSKSELPVIQEALKLSANKCEKFINALDINNNVEIKMGKTYTFVRRYSTYSYGYSRQNYDLNTKKIIRETEDFYVFDTHKISKNQIVAIQYK